MGTSGKAKYYLLFYNVVCLVGWTALGSHLVQHVITHGMSNATLVYSTTNTVLRFAQTLSILEILYACLGIVHSNPFITAIQTASRIHLVWILWPIVSSSHETVCHNSLFSSSSSPLFPSHISLLLLSPSHNSLLSSSSSPLFPILSSSSSLFPSHNSLLLLSPSHNSLLSSFLLYVFHSLFTAFIILYPIGIFSEIMCIVIALPFLGSRRDLSIFPSPMPNSLNFEVNLFYIYIVILVAYVPLSFQLYHHMLMRRAHNLTEGEKAKS
ncbi:protein tyrosine phosphatase family protein, ptpla protein [Cardiosporidium cionae]|uniref:very-long-chain (3R)-3-hydroxyacyl-CoA dehydratase n=1 Tax=Cardiosporidium cionae TaxID=476202 RepID=A0ABQ7JDB6_9APIC|nr:protein tyrosine phosphatase family protein, ptpla protein [Cardiosporidium cionae]|eukprot:KAF8821620.1 protein tyrosine phosphatase family protein, ptpla protein [Cardiosporidium cionae]